jgi:hypothetical protein
MEEEKDQALYSWQSPDKWKFVWKADAWAQCGGKSEQQVSRLELVWDTYYRRWDHEMPKDSGPDAALSISLVKRIFLP